MNIFHCSMLCVMLFAAALLAPARSCNAAAEPDDALAIDPNYVPMGVYVSIGLMGDFAKINGRKPWDDFAKQLDLCVERGVNTVWVNTSARHLPKLIELCGQRHLKLLASLVYEIEVKKEEYWKNGDRYYRDYIPRLVKMAGGSDTLVGWVLSDEPATKYIKRLETVRRLFKKYDPKRFCLTVTLHSVTPHIAPETGLPVVCVDLYPFFSHGSKFGPSTPNASRSFFRSKTAAMLKSLDDDTVGWVMPQCFVEIWGPYEFRADGHAIALPGSYLNWRGPTPAEVRWQAWETFRSGARGSIFFVLNPIMRGGEQGRNNKSPDPVYAGIKLSLQTRSVDAGAASLVTPDNKPTPQFDALGEVYRALGPYRELIRRWRVVDTGAEVKGPGAIQVFEDPKDQTRYAIVVNDDFKKPGTFVVHFGKDVAGARDLVKDQDIRVAQAPAGGSIIRLSLKPGAGVLLKLR